MEDMQHLFEDAKDNPKRRLTTAKNNIHTHTQTRGREQQRTALIEGCA